MKLMKILQCTRYGKLPAAELLPDRRSVYHVYYLVTPRYVDDAPTALQTVVSLSTEDETISVQPRQLRLDLRAKQHFLDESLDALKDILKSEDCHDITRLSIIVSMVLEHGLADWLESLPCQPTEYFEISWAEMAVMKELHGESGCCENVSWYAELAYECPIEHVRPYALQWLFTYLIKNQLYSLAYRVGVGLQVYVDEIPWVHTVLDSHLDKLSAYD